MHLIGQNLEGADGNGNAWRRAQNTVAIGDNVKVLVTGGAGFIGSHTCEQLLRAGHEVSILDDLNNFYSPAAKQANLEAIRRQGTYSFFQGDISDERRVNEVFAESRPDAVIHLAARAGVRPSLEQPLLYGQVNVRAHSLYWKPAGSRAYRNSSLPRPVPSTVSPTRCPFAKTIP